ncbi:hypothetical protein ACOSP7_015268 [Xanthoceras sorbifolium]
MKGSYITVEDASAPANLTGLPSFTRTSSIQDSGWRPRGVLVAHLQEHRSAVNGIAVSNDHNVFVSASMIPLSSIMLRNSAQVVVGACDGIIHMFSVDHISIGQGNVVEKYSGIADIKKKDTKEGPIVTLVNYNADNCVSQMFMYSTQNCRIRLWDSRSNLNPWTLKAIPEEGYVSSLVASPCGNWFVSGSSRGDLTLWDLRFFIPVNSWQYSHVCPVEKICLFVPPPYASVSTTARPLIYVAAGCNEVSLWNAENGSCQQVLRVTNYDGDAETHDLPWALARSSFGVQVVQEKERQAIETKLTSKAVLAAAATDSAGCHRDSIVSLASVKLNQRLLISSARDGNLKVEF